MKKSFFIGVALAAVLVLSGCNLKSVLNAPKNLTQDQAKEKVSKFITDNLVSPGTKVEITGVSEENGLYKVMVKLNDQQEITSYLTKDGTKFFPNVKKPVKKYGSKKASEPQQTS